MIEKKKIAVIGAGAAGLIAAGEASADNSADVVLFEKNGRIGKKIVITGKGRCNLTNLCSVEEFLKNVPTNHKFLYAALNYFPPQKTYEFFECLGVKLKVERGRRVFPESDKSFDIVDALRDNIKRENVKLIYENVMDISPEESGKIKITTENSNYIADKVIIATGGLSYPSTGSTGDGYRFAERLGHKIIPLKPSLVPLEIKEKYCAELMGLSLKNVQTTLCCDNIQKYSERGEMIFTHFGVSGPLILSFSSYIRDLDKYQYRIGINFKPALDEGQLDKRLLSDFLKFKNKAFKNSLNELLPQKLIPVIVELSYIPPDIPVNEITKAQRTGLLKIIRDFPLTVKGLRPVDEAVITSGGVCVNEINPATMESKLVKNVYFAGEVIDVDAFTGGYNMQIAFSTGKLAGLNALKSCFN